MIERDSPEQKLNEENLILLRRMLSCGINSSEFNDHFRSLEKSDQDRLIRVAMRLQLTFMIRYDLSFTIQPGMGESYEFRIENVELASLEVYLLMTCLDTLAGKTRYSQFDQWVENELEDKSFSKKDIIEIFEDYRENYGPRRTLKKEFLNFPDAHQKWIKENVAILKSGEFPTEEVREKNTDGLYPRLFEYFYDIRRNEYTHASITRETAVSRDPEELFEGWSISLAGWDYQPDKEKHPNKKLCLWYRIGLDEATILRVIIHGVVLSKLGIVPDTETINSYLKNERRRKVITGVIREIEGNASLISWWGSFDGNNVSSTTISYLYHVGIPMIHKEWSESFLGVIIDVNFESGYRERLPV